MWGRREPPLPESLRSHPGSFHRQLGPPGRAGALTIPPTTHWSSWQVPGPAQHRTSHIKLPFAGPPGWQEWQRPSKVLCGRGSGSIGGLGKGSREKSGCQQYSLCRGSAVPPSFRRRDALLGGRVGGAGEGPPATRPEVPSLHSGDPGGNTPTPRNNLLAPRHDAGASPGAAPHGPHARKTQPRWGVGSVQGTGRDSTAAGRGDWQVQQDQETQEVWGGD